MIEMIGSDAADAAEKDVVDVIDQAIIDLRDRIDAAILLSLFLFLSST